MKKIATVHSSKNNQYNNYGVELNTCEKVFGNGDDYFQSLLAEIAASSESIELEVYMFMLDSLGLKLVAALGKAVERGVNVRVLIDGVGSIEDGRDVLTLLTKKGVGAKIYHPLPWQVDRYRWSIKQGGSIARFIFFIQNINQRDHRKICIIDGRVLWTGSFNISVQHLSAQYGGDGWRDIGVRIVGDTVLQVKRMFNAIWDGQSKRLGKRTFKNFLSNISPINRRRKYRFITNKLNRAKKRIWITSAYFAPSSIFVNALVNASKNGIDVRLVVPYDSDVFFFPSLTATYYDSLIKAGVDIFEYRSGFLHAKVVIIDDFYLLGSSNFNHRSFFHDLEFDAILSTKSAKNELMSQFIADVDSSSKITREHLQARSWQIIFGWIPRLLRYWF